MVSHPARSVVEFPRSSGATYHQLIDEIEERFMTLGEIRHLCRPVVHLQVDVDVVITVPGSLDVGTPDALQVCGKAPWSRGGDQQVSSKLEEGRHQIGVLLTLSDPSQSQIGREVPHRLSAEGE